MAGTAAWIDVLPNLSAFGTKLNSGVTAPRPPPQDGMPARNSPTP